MDQTFSPTRLLPPVDRLQTPSSSFSQLSSMGAFHHKKSLPQSALPYECINNSNNNNHLMIVHNNNNNNNDTLSPVPMSSIKMERDDCFDSSSPDLMHCKRSKFSPSPYSVNGNPPVAARRNERERNRVKQVNMGFSTLRQRVPDGVKNKKMSKVETLRSAVEYIKKLQKMLNESSNGAEGMMTMCGSRGSTETSSCTPDSGVSYHHAASSGNEVDSSSPISSTSPSSVCMEASDISYTENDRERCFNEPDDDIISFSKWFS